MAAQRDSRRRHPRAARLHRAEARRDALDRQQVFVVSPREGFVLATGGHRPAALFRTTDAGRHFTEVAGPRSPSRFTRWPDRVRSLTFADARRGYALVGDGWPAEHVMRTGDAGRTWRRDDVPGHWKGVLGLAGTGDEEFAVVLRHGRCSCRTDLFRQRVGTSHWHLVRALPRRDADSGVGLAAWGRSIWLTLGVGSSRHPVGLFSSDAGRLVARMPVTNAVSCGLAATSPSSAWVTCSTGMLEAFSRYDRRHLATLPVWGYGTADTGLDALSADVAVFFTRSGKSGIYLTTDGGRTFTRRSSFPALGARGDGVQPSFFSPRLALAVVAGRRVLRSTDGGVTWTPLSFRR
jgi:hypothetical protein